MSCSQVMIIWSNRLMDRQKHSVPKLPIDQSTFQSFSMVIRFRFHRVCWRALHLLGYIQIACVWRLSRHFRFGGTGTLSRVCISLLTWEPLSFFRMYLIVLLSLRRTILWRKEDTGWMYKHHLIYRQWDHLITQAYQHAKWNPCKKAFHPSAGA